MLVLHIFVEYIYSGVSLQRVHCVSTSSLSDLRFGMFGVFTDWQWSTDKLSPDHQSSLQPESRGDERGRLKFR